MRTKLYLASAAGLEEEARFARLSGLVSAARREKLAALRHPGARRLSLGAGLLLRHALAQEGLPPAEAAADGHGKPFFPDLPGFCFNLSHSGDRVLCAVSPAPVGCDVELGRRADLAVARRFFHPDEISWLFALPEAGRHDGFLRLWTCKESYVKAVGLGLALPLDSFAVSFGEGPVLSRGADARPWRLRSIREGDCFCALCALEGAETAEIIPVSLEEVFP